MQTSLGEGISADTTVDRANYHRPGNSPTMSSPEFR